MLRMAAMLSVCALLSSPVLQAQGRVAPEMLYHRVWAVVPLVGKGTMEDPKRPMFTPSRVEHKAAAEAIRAENTRTGKQRDPEPPAILSYTMQVSDDGKSALVEFVGLTPKSLAFITESKAPGVKTFERGKATKEEVEAELKKSKKDFNLDSLNATTLRGNNGNAKGQAK
jgi:hypothetical protein